jgi:cell division protein FtsN
MDIQFWIWLIVIVITLVARANKKKPQPFVPDQNDTPNSPANESKPISFEDLLREIQSAKAPKQQPVKAHQPPKKQVIQPQYDFEDYDDNIEDEIKSLENVPQNYKEDSIYETYESAKTAAFSRASLEETMKVEDTVVSFGKFKEFKEAESGSIASEYANELRNPKSFKRAMILNEILNRRF